jgi:signal peptidase I
MDTADPSTSVTRTDTPSVPEPPRLAGDPTRFRRRLVLALLLGVVVLVAGGIVLRRFFPDIVGVRVYVISSEAMEPTLMGHERGYSPGTGVTHTEAIHDSILVDTRAFQDSPPQPGEIIVFRAPARADTSAGDEGRAPNENVLAKRVVARGGQTVEMQPDSNGNVSLYVNGEIVDESHVGFLEPMENVAMNGASFAVDGPLRLKPDELFVLGDNRNHSNDSRYWGPLKQDRVIGKAIQIISPPGRERDLP